MRQTQPVPVSVVVLFQPGQFKPLVFYWRDRKYAIARVISEYRGDPKDLSKRAFSVVARDGRNYTLWCEPKTGSWTMTEQVE